MQFLGWVNKFSHQLNTECLKFKIVNFIIIIFNIIITIHFTFSVSFLFIFVINSFLWQKQPIFPGDTDFVLLLVFAFLLSLPFLLATGFKTYELHYLTLQSCLWQGLGNFFFNLKIVGQMFFHCLLSWVKTYFGPEIISLQYQPLYK